MSLRPGRPAVRAAALLALALAPPSSGAVPVLPKPERYVADTAGVFDDHRANALNEKLAQFERETSSQVVVFVDTKVPEGTTLEELANRSFSAWGIGQKEKKNGILFLVFVEDRKMRIEVGYGLEGAIPDIRARQITNDVVKPFFRKGDFAGGIEAGVDATLAAARGEPYRGTGRIVAQTSGWRGPPLWVLLFIGGLGIVLAFVVIAVIVKVVRAARSGDRSGLVSTGSGSSSSGWSSGSSSSSESSSSSSSSSSDFSGGGGDSGGGGASDSW